MKEDASDAGGSDCAGIKRLGRLIIKAFIARGFTAGTDDARVLLKALEQSGGIDPAEEETARFVNGHGEVDRAWVLFAGARFEGDARTDEGCKVVHDKLCIDLLKDRVVLIAMEEEGSHDVLNAPEGSLDLPALPVDLADHLRRELIAREIGDEQLEMSVTEINANEAKIDIEIVRFAEEVKGILSNDLKLRNTGVSFAAMVGELSVDGHIKLGIGKLIAGSEAIAGNILTAQDEVSADAGQMSDIVQRAIIAVGSDDAVFGILQAFDELKERLLLRMIVEIIDDGIDNDV